LGTGRRFSRRPEPDKNLTSASRRNADGSQTRRNGGGGNLRVKEEGAGNQKV